MKFLDLHTHQAPKKSNVISIQSISLTNSVLPEIPTEAPISLGLHPWYASLNQLHVQINQLTELAKQINVKLIGECGLDKLRGESIANQTLIFEAQIKLAEKLQKPLIIHCVKAFAELIAIKQRLNVKAPMIIHGFNKNEQLGKQLLKHGFLLSFGSAVLKSNTDLAKLISVTENFFLETDDDEVSIEEIYFAVANLKNCSVEELKAHIFSNWDKLNLL